MAVKYNDFVIKFANVNGSGSASANGMFAKALFRMGIPVATRNIFPSNIQGLPTWFEVRVSAKGYMGRREGVDIMVAMNAETFAETTGLIRKAMRDWSRSGQVAPSRWIAEPGRFFSAPTQTLLVPIVFKKSGKDRVRYLLDDSVYGQFSSIVYDHARPFWKVVKNGSASAVTTGTPVVNTADSKKAFFFGKTCDSLDLIAIQDKAPDYDIGDVFAFPWMGAYTSASATSFNGFALPSKTYINDTTSPINPLFNEIVPQKGEDNKLWLQRNEVNQEDVIFPIETRSKISLSVCNSSNSDE